MWTFARVELGMRKREFFSLTHRQWHALMQRHERRERRRDEMNELMIAQLTVAKENLRRLIHQRNAHAAGGVRHYG